MMNDSILSNFESLVRETKKSMAEVMSLAFQTGVRQLWRERTLAAVSR